MKFSDLSKEDQTLLNTDLGEYEKVAAEQIKVAGEMMDVGAAYAVEVVENIEKQAAEAKDLEDKKEEMDEESEKKASDISMFIEKGFVEELCKLGSEKYNDELAYIRPFVAQAMTADGATDEQIKVAMESMGEDESSKEYKKEDKKEEESEKKASVELSDEDKALLATDFGELEKEAAEQIKLANDMYGLGASYAQNIAAQLDESFTAEDGSEKVASKALDEESEKTAQELALFIEKGFVEKLASLGKENYDDESAYLNYFAQEKLAAEDKHYVRRVLLGNPISGAIEAKKGKKAETFVNAVGHSVKETLKGIGKGALGGAGVGAVVSAAKGAKDAMKGGGTTKEKIMKGLLGAAKSSGKGAGIGALVGGVGGSYVGEIKGDLGGEATRIHNQYSKAKK